MAQALTIVTALCAIGIWRALGMTVLDISFAGSTFIARLTSEIQRIGFPAPTSRDNQLVFYSASRRSAVVATVSEASAEVTGPVSIRNALKQVFPQAVEKPPGKRRLRGLVIVLTVCAITVTLMLSLYGL